MSFFFGQGDFNENKITEEKSLVWLDLQVAWRGAVKKLPHKK